MAKNTATDEDQTDVETKTEIAAERIANALDMELEEGVMSRNWPGKDKDVIIVSWTADELGVNSYHKARLIDEVYQSGANVRLNSTDDENSALEFEVRD